VPTRNGARAVPKKLTDADIVAAKWTGKRQALFDEEERGLMLRTTRSGPVWALKRDVKGKTVVLTWCAADKEHNTKAARQWARGAARQSG
jgi:hypothetical protein